MQKNIIVNKNTTFAIQSSSMFKIGKSSDPESFQFLLFPWNLFATDKNGKNDSVCIDATDN